MAERRLPREEITLDESVSRESKRGFREEITPERICSTGVRTPFRTEAVSWVAEFSNPKRRLSREECRLSTVSRIAEK